MNPDNDEKDDAVPKDPSRFVMSPERRRKVMERVIEEELDRRASASLWEKIIRFSIDAKNDVTEFLRVESPRKRSVQISGALALVAMCAVLVFLPSRTETWSGWRDMEGSKGEATNSPSVMKLSSTPLSVEPNFTSQKIGVQFGKDGAVEGSLTNAPELNISGDPHEFFYRLKNLKGDFDAIVLSGEGVLKIKSNDGKPVPSVKNISEATLTLKLSFTNEPEFRIVRVLKK